MIGKTNAISGVSAPVPKIKTVSGSIISIYDALAMPAVSLIADINAVQSGSGDPSPSNVRPISGWSNVNVYREAQYDAGATPYATISLNGTVYGGSLNVTTGVLTVTHALWQKNTADMDNSESTPGWRGCGIRSLIGAGVNKEFGNAVMNVGTFWSANTNSSNDILFLRTARYNLTQSEWIALAQDVQIVVELATPLTVQLSPTTVQMLLGNNVLWADSGDSELQYWARR